VAGLAQGLAALGLELPAEALARLAAYVELLEKWNRTYNLTGIRGPREVLTRHLLDCLAVVPHVAARTLLDVGSGAGLPGIPLALALPQSRVTLLESAQKKAAFLRQVRIELDLANVSVVCDRVEAWQPAEQFDLIISRAFSDLPEYVGRVGRLCRRGGAILAMKGAYPHDELARLPEGYSLQRVVALAVPGLDAERHLVVVKPA
jgi:16S rRNA (guanine527-N7)-methyltransferase